jgi:NAD(P)-dependent dehydrogenase (short-subunit alcohol dehydrogenase family)
MTLRATAVDFAREGARVVIGDIDNAGAEKTVASISNNGGEASYVRVDVTKPADVQQMITSAVTQYGGLDYAFNNAGLVGSNAGVVSNSGNPSECCSTWTCPHAADRSHQGAAA